MRDCRPVLLILAIATIMSCGPSRPERKLAREASRTCGVSEERVCIHRMEQSRAGRYGVGDFSAGRSGKELTKEETLCLARWSEARQLTFSTAASARCRTETELDIVDEISQSCRVPRRYVSVEQRSSWFNSDTVVTPTLSISSEAGQCLRSWSTERGYRYSPFIIFH